MRVLVAVFFMTVSSVMGLAQDHGLVGGVVNFQVKINYYKPGLRTVDSDIPRPMYSQIVKVNNVVPAPYHVRLSEFTLITEQEAVSLGVSQATIDSLKRQQQIYFDLYSDPYGELSFSKGYTGSYVGKVRKTFGTMGIRETPLNSTVVGGIRYARFFRDRLASYGWTNSWHLEDGAVSIAQFAGPNALVASSGVDLAFYAGHSTQNGPEYPGADRKQYSWGDLKGQTRGLRWMVTQSCSWFPNQPTGAYDVNNGPWATAMSKGNGSMHAIFAYSSKAFLWPSFIWDVYIPFGSVSDTDCAPVAFIENVMKYGGQNGPSWFLGSENQRRSMHKINQNYALNLNLLGACNNDYGAAPTVLSVSNWYNDYFYECLQNPWPDPVDLDDPNPTLMIHQLIVGSPCY